MFGLTYDIVPGRPAEKVILVMLPGAGMCAKDFRAHGFVETIRVRGLPVDTVMVDVNTDDYVSATFGKHMNGEIVSNLLAGGYQRIWLAGISLGAYGVMRLLQEQAHGIEGVLLLAPFLSTRGTIARIMGAGGLNGWLPLVAEREGIDESLLCWLKENLVAGKLPVEIYLGWGEADRYADASRLLAARLPPDRVFRINGDHDWPTWIALWHDMLNTLPFERVDCRLQ